MPEFTDTLRDSAVVSRQRPSIALQARRNIVRKILIDYKFSVEQMEEKFHLRTVETFHSLSSFFFGRETITESASERARRLDRHELATTMNLEQAIDWTKLLPTQRPSALSPTF